MPPPVEESSGTPNPDPNLDALTRLIAAWPGLTATPDPGLVADSLALLPHLEGTEKLVDVGTGGGLPGLPLRLARPGLRLTLIEANGRKAAFLLHATAALHLEGVEVVAQRAEVAGRDPAHREQYDVAVARALAALPVLVELCLPFVRVGGRLLAMKALGAAAELVAAMTAIEVLGGGNARIVDAPSAARPGGTVVIIDKVSPTPAAYPRRAGVPSRRPLNASGDGTDREAR